MMWRKDTLSSSSGLQQVQDNSHQTGDSRADPSSHFNSGCLLPMFTSHLRWGSHLNCSLEIKLKGEDINSNPVTSQVSLGKEHCLLTLSGPSCLSPPGAGVTGPCCQTQTHTASPSEGPDRSPVLGRWLDLWLRTDGCVASGWHQVV